MSIVACPVCNATLPSNRKLYCSDFCKRRAKYERQKDSGQEEIRRRRRNKPWAEHLALTARPDCSADGCDRKHVAKGLCLMHYKRTMPKKAGDSHRGRARRNGVAYEPINRRHVFERDGWLCGICGVSVDAALSFPNPMSASLDHVVPITKGGGHLYDNVQLAHLSCNCVKSDSLEVSHGG